MKYTINQKEEQLMILMVALRYQARHDDNENTRNKLYLVESIGKALYNIIFDSYDFERALSQEEAEKFSYVDEEYTYRQMVSEGVVEAFRDAAARQELDYEYTK